MRAWTLRKLLLFLRPLKFGNPDCYGIDMSKLGDFIAFKAAIELLKERGMEDIIKAVYEKIKELQRNNQLLFRKCGAPDLPPVYHRGNFW